MMNFKQQSVHVQSNSHRSFWTKALHCIMFMTSTLSNVLFLKNLNSRSYSNIRGCWGKTTWLWIHELTPLAISFSTLQWCYRAPKPENKERKEPARAPEIATKQIMWGLCQVLRAWLCQQALVHAAAAINHFQTNGHGIRQITDTTHSDSSNWSGKLLKTLHGSH